MASTNKTAHYEFPQYIGSDIPNILTDINPAFETIDTALYEQGQQIAEQTTDLSDIQEAVDQATADVAVMQSSIVQMAGIVETTRQLATDNKETIGQGSLKTTAQTLIGGVNELVDSYQTIAEVTADGSTSYKNFLKNLYDAIPSAYKESPKIKLVTYFSANSFIVYQVTQASSTSIIFGVSQYAHSSSYGYIRNIVLSSTADNTDECVIRINTGGTIVDQSVDMTTNVPNGYKYSIMI